ncbi:MAG TPA: SIS domain-containing protein [Ignavibacteria bacterium]|nr:SIS domain-containing protein [Ignavibacteria bacterium]
MSEKYIEKYFNEVAEVVNKIDRIAVGKIIDELVWIKKNGGRLFILGVGGSAANASHTVNDFRKICGMECYAPTDNVSELTARVNDDGWETVFVKWLITSRLNEKDGILILSVGGGNAGKNISVNLINAIDLAKERKSRILGIVGKDGGYTAKNSSACVIIPVVNESSITPHSESFQSVVLHLIVTHPDLKQNEMKWESTNK